MLKLALVATLFVASALIWAGFVPDRKSSDQFPSEVASKWFEALYDVIKAERTQPPPASRIYGITAVALYESVVAGMEQNRSLAGQLNGLGPMPEPKKNKALHWPTVANTTLANTIRGLYPALSQSSLDVVNHLEQSFASRYQAEVPKHQYKHSVAYGQAVSTVILEWAATDGFSIQGNCQYDPPLVPGAWEPTPPAVTANPVLPCWGQIRPMVLSSGEECPPPDHPTFSTDTVSEFYTAAQEVYQVGRGLTDEQKAIADYWSDGPGTTGTPPGHWIAIVSQIARGDNLSLAEAAEAYARVGIAIHDAFIGCWNTKYTYDLQRPVTFINDNIDDSWVSYIVTPNFPTYTSGHSTQSGAAASVLTDLFGTKSFTDTTHTDHGLLPPQEPRRFNSFGEAADEAAVSRLYAGIHFSFDNKAGLAVGQCIGQTIIDRVRFRDQSH
jgi:PAP2 superfamily